jgi:hypothetical protein
MDLTPQQLQQLQAQIDANPQVQAIVRAPGLMARDKQLRLQQLPSAVPQGYYLDEFGKVSKMDPAWIKYVAPLATMAGGAAAGFAGGFGGAAGAVGGGGTAAGGGSAAGVGGAGAGGAAGGVGGSAAAGGSGAAVGGGSAAAAAAHQTLLGRVLALAAPIAGAYAVKKIMDNGQTTNPANSILGNPNIGSNLNDLLGLQVQQARTAAPLGQSIVNMANGLLPTQYQK